MDTEALRESLRFLQTNRTFLGREFLTWLWFHMESVNHIIEIDGLGKFQLFVDDKLVLTSTSGSVHENALRGGTPAYATEAKTALLAGKLVQEAKFILQQDDKQWMWSMKAEDLAPRGLKLPPVQEPDAQAHMSRRVAHMQVLTDVLDALFKQYMSLRLTPQFSQEMENMAAWLVTKAAHGSPASA